MQPQPDNITHGSLWSQVHEDDARLIIIIMHPNEIVQIGCELAVSIRNPHTSQEKSPTSETKPQVKTTCGAFGHTSNQTRTKWTKWSMWRNPHNVIRIKSCLTFCCCYQDVITIIIVTTTITTKSYLHFTTTIIKQ